MLLSDRVRQILEAGRQEGRWSRYGLARQSGGRLTAVELSRFARGLAGLGLAKLDLLCDLMGVSVSVPNHPA